MAEIKLVINTIPRVKPISKVMEETGASRTTIEDTIKDDLLDCSFVFSGVYYVKGEEKIDKGYKVVVDNEKYSKFKVWCEQNNRIHK